MNSVNDYNKEALKYFYSGKYKEALNLWEEALEINTNAPVINYNIGFLYEDVENPEWNINKAIYYYEQSAENKFAKAYWKLGLIYAYIKEFLDSDKALECFLTANLLKENDPDITYSLASFYVNDFKFKDGNKAKYYYEVALKNGNEKAYFDLGVIFDKNCSIFPNLEKNVLKAKRYYEQSIKASKKALAMNNLGMLYRYSLEKPDYFAYVSWLWLAHKYDNSLSLANYNKAIKEISTSTLKIITTFNTVEDYKLYRKRNSVPNQGINIVSKINNDQNCLKKCIKYIVVIVAIVVVLRIANNPSDSHKETLEDSRWSVAKQAEKILEDNPNGHPDVPYVGMPEAFINDTSLGIPDEIEYSYNYSGMQERARWIIYTWYDEEGIKVCQVKVSKWDSVNKKKTTPYVSSIQFTKND